LERQILFSWEGPWRKAVRLPWMGREGRKTEVVVAVAVAVAVAAEEEVVTVRKLLVYYLSLK
jgi:hypothetical protein